MKKTHNALLILLFLGLSARMSAQEKQIKEPQFRLGKVSAEDFDLSGHNFDTTASAVIIASKGYAHMDRSGGGPMGTVFRVYKRIKVLSEDGKKLANNSFRLFGSQKLKGFTGYTHTLVNGKVQSSEMGKKDYYYDNESELTHVVKFTVPKVRVGSIIEIEYEYTSTYVGFIRDWNFQDKYPVLWSSFSLQHYEVCLFYVLEQVYHPFAIRKVSKGSIDGSVGDSQAFGSLIKKKWALKDLPALVPEAMVYRMDNYRSKLQFELSYISGFSGQRNFNRENWKTYRNYLLEDANWYKPFFKNHKFFDKLIKKEKDEDRILFAKRVFYKIRDQFKTQTVGSIQPQKAPLELFKMSKASNSEINLYLVSCLKHFGYTASPLLINTRENGKPVKNIPIMQRLNYTICCLTLGGKRYYLDASKPYYKFNKIPLSCYNGAAHLIGKTKHKVLNLSADSITEGSEIKIKYSIDPKNQKLHWSEFEELGYHASLKLRKILEKKSEEDMKKLAIEARPQETELDSFSIRKSTLDTFKYQVQSIWSTDFNMSGDTWYIPLNLDQSNSDLLKALKPETRTFPFELPSGMFQYKTTELHIPDGYNVIEHPKPISIELENGKGQFTYMVNKANQSLIISTILRINKSIFLPNEYNELRKFFSLINELKEEIIVIKKA